MTATNEWERYDRQMRYAPLGVAGQQALRAARALIVGVGGLGSWLAELLARAGVGTLRLVDSDRVELANIHRQAIYTTADAAGGVAKVHAAAWRLAQLNEQVQVEPLVERLTADNAERLALGMDLVLDGSDNFATRFVLNDYAVKHGRPWVFAGVVGAEGQVMTILPGKTACLRCLFDAPPPVCVDPTCRAAGVLGPAVATIAAIQAAEAVKLLSGHAEAVRPTLLKLDLWTNAVQQIDIGPAARNPNCPCCGKGHYDYMEP